MKTGIIIYVSGEVPLNWCEKDEINTRKSDCRADAVEIITSVSGHYDVLDAWWFLTSRGMKLVVCKLAEFSNSGKLIFTGRELRLCG
jgi:hypothetical protein